MDNLGGKSKRASVRTTVTKLITKCETSLEANIAETDSDSLLESLELLNENSKIFKELDWEIDFLINEKSEYEKVVKTVEDIWWQNIKCNI